MFLRSGRPTREIPLRDMALLTDPDNPEPGLGGAMGIEAEIVAEGVIKGVDNIDIG